MWRGNEPTMDYSDYILASYNTRGTYGLYDSGKLRTSMDRHVRNVPPQRHKTITDRQQNYHHYTDLNTSDLPWQANDKAKHTRIGPQTRRDKLNSGHNPDPRYINLTDLFGFEQASNYDHREYFNTNVISGFNLYEMADRNRQARLEKGDLSKISSNEDGSNFIDKLGSRSRRRLHSLPRSLDSNIINNLPHVNQSTKERTVKMVNVDNYSFSLSGRTIRNETGNLRNHRLLPASIGDMKPEKSNSNKEMSGHIDKKEDINYAYISPECLSVAETPIKLLERPARAKRMDLHKPELLVIPEIGGTFQQQNNMDSARKDMLLSVPLSSRHVLSVPRIDRGERSRTKLKPNVNSIDTSLTPASNLDSTIQKNTFSHGTHLDITSQKNTPFVTGGNLDLTVQKYSSKYFLDKPYLKRLDNTSEHQSFFPRNTSDDLMRWTI